MQPNIQEMQSEPIDYRARLKAVLEKDNGIQRIMEVVDDGEELGKRKEEYEKYLNLVKARSLPAFYPIEDEEWEKHMRILLTEQKFGGNS